MNIEIEWKRATSQRLKLDGSVMVIDTIEGNAIECIYLQAGKVLTKTFPLDSIELLPSKDLFNVFSPSVNN